MVVFEKWKKSVGESLIHSLGKERAERESSYISGHRIPNKSINEEERRELRASIQRLS